MYKKFPDRVLTDLPESVSSKIKNNVALASSDCRVAKSYLEKTLIHPENACDSVGQAISLIKFYMEIRASVPQTTVDYMLAHVRDEQFLLDLQSYDKISPTVKVVMNTLPLRNSTSSLLSFCHINSDQGFRRWNLYAENYGKLIKSVKRWCELEATHLRGNCEYMLYLDEYHIGNIVCDKVFEPNPSSDMQAFIIKFFDAPVTLPLHFTMDLTDACVSKAYNLDCKVLSETKHSSVLMLPAKPDMSLHMIQKNVLEISKRIIDMTRFQESMSCDIEGAIFFNNEQIGSIDIDSGEPRFTEEGTDVLGSFCGIQKVVEPISNDAEKEVKMSFLQRLRFLFRG
ncbi:hypothetical protein OTK49_01425 [Vibrio coralliirubri]|uniref:hypothetical protein n=1 Tax=Vibrio coralliirubri TaxID=1516159 RepID=UPI002284F466|nr:hypothetical protein [Vibrio coralliirubri]MCY9861185.1 hypothetical protein [Vibrio coralliirubri]